MSNQYTYEPPCSADLLHEMYVTKGLSQHEIAKELGVSQKVIFRAMQKAGIQARIARKRNQIGAANSSWKGGVVLQPKKGNGSYFDRGYRLVRRPDHPNANSSGYVYEHIAVAVAEEGLDALPAGHCVHHINLIKDDNEPDNLVIADHKTHQAYHTQLEELAVRLLLTTGKIKFIRGTGYVES